MGVGAEITPFLQGMDFSSLDFMPILKPFTWKTGLILVVLLVTPAGEDANSASLKLPVAGTNVKPAQVL